MTTRTAQVLTAHAVAESRLAPGSVYMAVAPDVILGHDATIALLIGRVRKAGLRIAHPERCLFAADHFVPAATEERASILHDYVRFVEEQGVSTAALYQGISHQLMVEDRRCVPGALIAGADSHTTMAGALGTVAIGFGSTDILGVLVRGVLFVRIPEAVHVRVVGRRGPHVSGKDVALLMMRHFGEGGATYRALEIEDQTPSRSLTMADRMTLANMAVDCGAKNALVVPDEVTAAYVTARDGAPAPFAFAPPVASDYHSVVELDLSHVTPLVARPGSPADVAPASDAGGERIDQVVIGSCCGGRLEDLHEALAVLAGRRVPDRVRFVVTPASRQVYEAALADGTALALSRAGAMVTVPSCGACGGIDKGLLGAGEVCVSTSNRNFRGRMGSIEARIYLASAATAAASALLGRVADPREVA